jgi:hypothetical protein
MYASWIIFQTELNTHVPLYAIPIYMLIITAAPPIRAPMATAAVGTAPAPVELLVDDAVALARALSIALLADSRRELREVEAAPLAVEMLDLRLAMSLLMLAMLLLTLLAASVLVLIADEAAPRTLSAALDACSLAEETLSCCAYRKTS